MNKVPMCIGIFLSVFVFLHWVTSKRPLEFWEVVAVISLQLVVLVLDQLINIAKALRK